MLTVNSTTTKPATVDFLKFKTRESLNKFLIAERLKLLTDEPFCASYRTIQPHIDRNAGYQFRFFEYLGKSHQPMLFTIRDEQYIINHGEWVWFDCQETHSATSIDWMSFQIWGCEYRHRLESFSNRV